MTDHPIIFSAPMVRALLDGRKTMTRRIPTPQWLKVAAGDRLYVRENFSGPYDLHAVKPKDWPAGTPIWYWADGAPTEGDWTKPKPSIHLPRTMSRLTMVVTATKTESLDAISGTDAIAEGLASLRRDGENWHWDPAAKHGDGYFAPWRAFKALWESLHGAGSFDARPVVALTFTVHKVNIDQMAKEAA